VTTGAPAWAGPRRIAHRGGGTLAPENTMAGIREGIARGYRAVEFDVMLTADEVPVLMHDPTFGRTIAGRGRVAATTWDDLSRRDAGAWFAARFAGEPVPRYEDVARFCRANGIWMNVEIKPSPGVGALTGRRVAEVTAALFAEGGQAKDGPLFSSFDTEALDAARAVAPHIARGVLFDAVPDDAETIATALGCISVHANQRKLDATVARRLRAAGFAVLAYTVDDPARVRSLDEAGVDAVFVDRIDRVPFA
jgi:glycerophosphoryl diester phosphodiesterase